MAGRYGVTLCVKAHVGAAIYNTLTTLRALKAITSKSFGLDMDPSHIYRANEDPVEAILDFARDRFQVRLRGSRADHKKIGEGRDALEIEDHDLLRFFVRRQVGASFG